MSPSLIALLLSLIALLLSILPGAPASAQADRATLLTDENFRALPNGAVVAVLLEGTETAVVDQSGEWLEVEIDGYVWMASLNSTDRSGFDLVVVADDGENLRERPQGDIVARLARGSLLKEVDRERGWARVVRRGFLWTASARVSPMVPTQGGGLTPGSDGLSRDADPSQAVDPSSSVVTAGPDGTAIVAAPGGDTLALTAPETALKLGGRRGGWVRVRLDGWAWLPPGSVVELGESTAPGPTPPELAAQPESHAGRTVVWELRFVAEELAGAHQTDFVEGETYLLCRWGTDDHFVYVAVPDDQIGIGSGLAPLESIVVTGRVRSGASVLTSSPVIDLLSLKRGGVQR